jgi:hypothetical protein
MRSLRIFLLAGPCLTALAEPAAATTTWLGAVPPAGATGGGCGVCSYVQAANAAGSPSYVVPAGAGVITQWSVRGGTTVGDGDRAQLRVFRPGPSGGYIVVADSPPTKPPALGAWSFPVRIPVVGGDVYGLPDTREDRNRTGRRDRGETDPRGRDTDSDAVPDRADRFPLDRRR